MTMRPVLQKEEMVDGQSYLDVVAVSPNNFFFTKIIVLGAPFEKELNGKLSWFIKTRPTDQVEFADVTLQDRISLEDANIGGSNCYNMNTVWRVTTENQDYLESLMQKGAEGFQEYLAVLNKYGISK